MKRENEKGENKAGSEGGVLWEEIKRTAENPKDIGETQSKLCFFQPR